MWTNVPLTMVGVLTCVTTLKDPLCAAVELDSPWPVMDEAAMVSRLTAGCISGKGEMRKGREDQFVK